MIIYMGMIIAEVQAIHIGFAVFGRHYHIQVIPDQSAIDRYGYYIGNAFTYLVHMRGAYYFRIGFVVLYFIKIEYSVFFNHQFYYLVGKAFIGTNCNEGFHDLNLGVLRY